jgi:glycosyltransferase involved in cell wall biosynthesis
MALLSIIIPTYNRKGLIGYTLDSVRPEKHPDVDLEVIVIDDHSTDDTTDYIREKYPWVNVYPNTGKGAPAARNLGIEKSTGRYLNFLDSDDLVGEGFYKEKIKALDADESLDSCYGQFECFSSTGEFATESITFKHKYPLIVNADSYREHLKNYLGGFYTPPHTVIWRRSFVDKVGRMDTGLQVNQDVDFFIRTLMMKMRIAGVADGTIAMVRNHESDNRVGAATGNETKYQHILQLRRKFFEQLKSTGLDSPEVLESLSTFLFNKWRETRKNFPATAKAFLDLAKEVYWPLKPKGGAILGVLTAIFGPVAAIKIKEFLR